MKTSTEPSSRTESKKKRQLPLLRESTAGSKEAFEGEPTRTRPPRRRRSRHRSSLHLNSSTCANADGKRTPISEKANETSVTDTGNDVVHSEPKKNSAGSPAALQAANRRPQAAVADASVDLVVPTSSPESEPSLPQLSHVMQGRNVFGGALLMGHDENNPASDSLSPRTPDPVPSPATREPGDDFPNDAHQEAATKSQARKTSVRFGTTTIWKVPLSPEAIVNQSKLIFSAIALVLTTAIIGVGILFALARTMAYGPRVGECSTASCKQAIHDMEILIDYSVEPCKDFYRHVCHRWEENHGAAVDGDSASFLDIGVERFLRDVNASLRSVERAKPASADFLHAAKFYSSCERFLSSPNVSLSEVLLPFRKYGEEVLSHSSFTGVGRYIVELSLARGIPTVLDVRLSRFPDGVFLRILRGQTLSQKLGVEQALPLQDYLEEVLRESSIIHGREFNLTYVLEIEQRLQNYMVGESHEQRQGTAVLQYLSTAIPRREWLNALNAHLPDAHQLSSRSVISIGNIDVIRHLLYFFKGLVDYGVVYLYAQVLLDALRFDYLRRLSKSDTQRVVLSCLQATRLAMRKATTAIFSEILSEQGTTAVIRRVFRHVREVVADGNAFTWMSTFRREEARRRLQDVDVHQFRTIWSLNENPDTYNLTEASVSSEFPSLFITLKELQQRSLLEDPSAVQQTNIDDAFLRGTEVFYDSLSNTVVIPAFMRREPIVYVDDVPPEYSVGTLGVLLARALLQTALPQNNVGAWADFEKTSLHRFEHCVHTWASLALNLSLRYAPNDDHPEYYVWSHSARSAYEVLRQTYEGSVTIRNWKSQWQSAQEIFFRRFCLLSCRVRNVRKHPASVICFLPHLNMKEFSEVLGCQYSLSGHAQHYCVL